MESLLVNLRKYRPRENTDPLENFITEAFAWLLKSSDDVQKAVFNMINERFTTPIILPKTDCQISTQENFDGKYPDMVTGWHNCTWVFEHKVWSELHENQIKNYRDYIAHNSSDHRIILITASRSQHAQQPDAALCWEDISRCLTQVAEQTTDGNTTWALNDFLKLLESEGLGVSTPINRFSIAHYLEAIKLDQQVDKLLKVAIHSPWPLAKLGFTPVFKRQKVEGRVGLDFSPEFEGIGRKWLPGIFCGMLIDGTDHGVIDILKNQLHMCMVFDFNRDGQKKINNNAVYQNFKQDLSSSVKSLSHNWTVIDAETEHLARLNKWHPLMLILPMAEIFSHTSHFDEQVDVFHRMMAEIQDKLIALDSFTALVNALAPSKNRALTIEQQLR